MPPQWSATAILHPFSPPPSDEPKPDTPFFQLCTARFDFSEGQFLSAQISGCEYGTWWYFLTPQGTELSLDKGKTWNKMDLQWELPSGGWFGAQQAGASCAGLSYLNWMRAQAVEWWKIPVAGSLATTWFWMDAETRLPFRMMFGQPPPKPTTGDPHQLAIFQMFSFTYFPSFEVSEALEPPRSWLPTAIPGFSPGDTKGFELVEWKTNFGMTTLMTPVNEASNPMPTRVLYHWAADDQYKELTDRAQSTLMWFPPEPPSKIVYQVALMYGGAPKGMAPPPHSDSSYLLEVNTQGKLSCELLHLGEEPPWWARIPAVKGTIRACIEDNPALCPGNRVAVISIVFPPSDEYPQGRYLWTWYSPFPGSQGAHSRPVTFMESGSEIGVGTSLALADYFDYREFQEPIPASCLQLPPGCPDHSTR
jgi:hypothetical protein